MEKIPVEVRYVQIEESNSGGSICYIELPDRESEELSKTKEVLVLGRGLGNVINIYFPEQWIALQRYLERDNGNEKHTVRIVKRHFYGNACECEMQENRLYIPESLLEFCKIEKNAVLTKYEKDGEFYYIISKLK